MIDFLSPVSKNWGALQSGTPYFVRSLQDLKGLVTQQDWPEISITIFHHRQYPLRGIVNDELMGKALDYIHDNEWYTIISPKDYYPSRCIFYGSGNSHTELRQDLEELAGELVGIGRDPFDYDTTWFHFNPDILMVSMTKNQTYYEPFVQHPDKYEWVKNMWWK